MSSLFTRANIKLLIVGLLLLLFGSFYWQTIMELPLFGDATIHGLNANDVYSGGWENLRADYPGYYSYLMAIIYSFDNSKGYNLVPYASLIFLLIAVYLFSKQLTKNFYLAVLSIILVASSPKIVLYSAKMYQEILISAFFIFTFFLAFKFLESKTKMYLFLMSLFLGIAMSLKQQSLFILYPSIIALFTYESSRRRINFSELAVIIFLPLVVSLPFYGVLFHNKGRLQPGSEEFVVFKIINNIGQKVFFYEDSEYKPENFIQGPLKEKISQIESEHSELAFKRAESRHIWPTEVLTDFNKFNEANSLYNNVQGKPLESPMIFYFWFFALMLGFITALIKYKSYDSLILLTVVFLAINYVLFSRNNDQQRYHIFIPIFLLIYILIFLRYIFFRVNEYGYKKSVIYILLSILFFLPIVTSRINLNKWWINSQLYSSSIGGIPSVEASGDWINKNVPKNAFIGQQCGNETRFYSKRRVEGDWKVNFLEDDELDEYFKSQNISYYVVNKSQIADDEDWYHICWVRKSFFTKLVNKYQKIYESPWGDIYVFKIL